MINNLKVFSTEGSLWLATDADHVRVLYRDENGEELGELDDVIELSDEELDAKQPEYDEGELPTGENTTLRKIAKEHGEAGSFASRQW